MKKPVQANGGRRFFGYFLDFHVFYSIAIPMIVTRFAYMFPAQFVDSARVAGTLIFFAGVLFLLSKGRSPSKFLLGVTVLDVKTPQKPALWKLLLREPLRMVTAMVWMFAMVPVVIFYVLWASRHDLFHERTASQRSVLENIVIDHRTRQATAEAQTGLNRLFAWIGSKPKLLYLHDTVLGTTSATYEEAAEAQSAQQNSAAA
jgi:hypothetical protein